MNFPPPYSSADSKRPNQQQSTVVQVVQPPMIAVEPPEDWMIISIVNCVCCCWLLGIIAIVLSANSRSAAKIGEQAMWIYLSFVFALSDLRPYPELGAYGNM